MHIIKKVLSCLLFFSMLLTSVLGFSEEISAADTIDATANHAKNIPDSQWYLGEIGLPSPVPDFAWEPDASPVIAVIDTGILPTHPALKDSRWVNEAEQNGIEGVDDDGNGYVDDIYGYNVRSDTGDVTDTDGHGTHIAGIIAMQSTEDSDARGVCPDARIMTIKAGNTTNGFSSENVVKAIHYAIANGADVINLSLGTTYCTDELRATIEEASQHAVLVAAAGNGSSPTKEDSDTTGDNMFPASLPEVIGVMSFNQDRELAWFSNWDRIPNTEADYELIAPGEDIYSTTLKNSYKEESGTSMSSAIVSGACGILIGEWRRLYGNNETHTYTPDFIRECLLADLQNTVTYVDSEDCTHLFPMLHIGNALQYLKDHGALMPSSPSEQNTPTPSASDTPLPGTPTPLPSGTPAQTDSAPLPSGNPTQDTPAPLIPDVPVQTESPLSTPPSQTVPSPSASMLPVQTEAPGGDTIDTNSKKSSRIKTRTPIIKKKSVNRPKRKQKITISFSVKGISPDGWVIYRSSRKNGSYHRYADCRKNRFTIKKQSKTYFYYVRAYTNIGAKKTYSRKSKTIKI